MTKPDALHDPADLSKLDENEQAREVYAWAGLALYYAQVTEFGAEEVDLLVEEYRAGESTKPAERPRRDARTHHTRYGQLGRPT